LGQRLTLDLPRRRRLHRCRLVGSRRSRVGIAVRIFSETGGFRAACRSTNGNGRQSPPTQRTMRTPPRFFTTHNRTHTQTPHHTGWQLNSTEVNISLNCRGLIKVSEILPSRARCGFARQATRGSDFAADIVPQSSRARPGRSGTKRTPMRSSRSKPVSVRVSLTRHWLPPCGPSGKIIIPPTASC
jgi:hypothetical protein